MTLPHYESSFEVVQVGEAVRFSGLCGLIVTFDGVWTTNLTVAAVLSTDITGMCGTLRLLSLMCGVDLELFLIIYCCLL